MRKYLFIGIGGVIGAILRYTIKSIYTGQGNIPIDTLFINMAGCFFIALILTITLERLEMSSAFRLGITTGMLGAFTTFSTICKETASLMSNGLYLSAALYAIGTLALGFLGVYLGTVLGREIIKSRTKGKETKEDHIINGSEK